MYSRCREVLIFQNPEEFVRLESEYGETLTIHINVDRIEAESPEKIVARRRGDCPLVSAVRWFTKFPMPLSGEPESRNLPAL